MVNLETKLGSREVCHVFLQTGLKLPQADVVKKWHEGAIKLTINPGANKKFDPFIGESEPLIINEKFAVNSQGVVDCEFWIDERAQIGEPMTLKIEIARAEKHGYTPYFIIRSGPGTLRHLEDHDFVKEARDADLQNIRNLVPWCDVDKLSPSKSTNHIDQPKYKDLPRFLQFRNSSKDAFYGSVKHGAHDVIFQVGHIILGKLLNLFLCRKPSTGVNSFASLDDYAKSFPEMGESCEWSKADIKEGMKVGEIFRDDGEFGRQIIQGPNSMKLSRVDKLSPTWQEGISQGTLPDYAIDGEDVHEVIKDGRLFEVVNSKLLEGVGHGGLQSQVNHMLHCFFPRQTWYVVQADCLFFVSKKRNPLYAFVPVMIRLQNQNDCEPQTFWGPPKPGSNENGQHALSWLYAKMYFRCADWQVYSIGTHFARAHALSEVFGTSMYRNLPSAHPLFRILQPHLQGIIAINAQARDVLVNPGNNAFARFMSAGDNLGDLLEHCCKDMLKYKHLIIPEDFKARGLGDIPQFLYRDDSIALWNILHEYTTNMIDLSYPKDEDVRQDSELKNFLHEFLEYGVKAFAEAGDFPDHLDTKEELSTYITAIIYNVSCFHTGVNFQINKYLAYFPNAPPSLIRPPPGQKDIVTMTTIMESLPKRDVAVITMAATEMLGKFSPIERFYSQTKAFARKGYFGENMAVSEEQEEIIGKMTSAMVELTSKIRDRNEELGKQHGEQDEYKHFLAYDVLSPHNIPLTTEI
ncbi:hypothetical protein ACHWQZ_G012916 [Mnemiopsis leidyi]